MLVGDGDRRIVLFPCLMAGALPSWSEVGEVVVWSLVRFSAGAHDGPVVPVPGRGDLFCGPAEVGGVEGGSAGNAGSLPAG
jgi:hypothetical protein